jgi:hypothetical protein
MILYHHTDTARLPWILKSGELRPGRNAIGGYPDPDFLWATTDHQGDATASAHRGEHYRSGKIRHVRFVLDSADFIPWSDISAAFPSWTPDHIDRLEGFARSKSTSPSSWWVRAEPIAVERARIETRSYTNNRWTLLSTPDVVSGDEPGWLTIAIGGKTFASRMSDGPDGQGAFEVGELMRPSREACWD